MRCDNPNVRMGMLGQFGLTWPWESLHEEALAWYDHWLKGADTGIMDGPPIRYMLPGAEEWRTAEEWPPVGSTLCELALCADGTLADDKGLPGSRQYLVLGAGLNRVKPSAIDPPSVLAWTSAPMDTAVNIVGNIELCLVATATAIDTAWMATLFDVAPDGSAEPITAGWLRASLRQVDPTTSVVGSPVLPCRTAEAVPIGEDITYRIPLVPNARRVAAGHSIRLVVTSDDQDPTAASHHELPARQRGHQQSQHRSLVVSPAATDLLQRFVGVRPALTAARRT